MVTLDAGAICRRHETYVQMDAFWAGMSAIDRQQGLAASLSTRPLQNGQIGG